MSESSELRSEIAQEMSLDHIRYSQVWEDHLLLEHGLEIGPDDDVLSICSAGCNVLNLLLLEPRSVTAIDMNRAQTALLELKLRAIERLGHGEFCALLGLSDEPERALALYQGLRGTLGDMARAFWDQHTEDIRSGIVHCGRLERYIRRFHEEFLPELVSAHDIQRLLQAEDLASQKRIFEEAFENEGFIERFRWYFGQEMMETNGRDPAQFQHVEHADVGDYFLNRFRFVCTELPTRDNFYLHFFLTSSYGNKQACPTYLRPREYERLRGLVQRVIVVEDELERFVDAHPQGTFSKANLSDIFEYMSPELTEHLLACLATRFRRGGRLAYWNLLVPRQRPDTLAALLTPHSELAHRLWRQDRSWFYRSFVLEEIGGS